MARRRSLLRTHLAFLLVLTAMPGACGDDDGPRNGGGQTEENALEERGLDYLRLSTATVSAGSVVNAIAHMGREVVDPGYSAPAGSVSATDWDERFDKVNTLRDTSDFDVITFVYALHRFAGDPFVDAETWRKTKQAVLDFKYWYTDPTLEGKHDDMWYWTENHQMVFDACEYLAGQLYPDDIFTATGWNGREHQARARERLLKWFEYTQRFGFREFHSNVYYSVQFTPLMALAELADAEDIRTRAAMTLDLMVFDLALHTQRGSFGVPHGRSYKKDKMSALDEGTFHLAKLLFDTTDYDYPGSNDTETILMLVGTKGRAYRPPQVILDAGQSPGPFVDRERMNLPLDEEEDINDNPRGPYEIGFTSEDDMLIWWGASIQTPWQILPTTIVRMNEYDLWENEGFADFKPFENLVRDDPLALQGLSYDLRHVMNFAVLPEINSYTYRTPDYMLASALDFRRGYRATQAHHWQATFDANACVFTTHPGHEPLETTNWREDGEPGQWTGSATSPRIGQFENVAVLLYSPLYSGHSLFDMDAFFAYVPYTHAYFPQDHFDEVEHMPGEEGQSGSWTFGRFRDGYIALYSMRPARWIAYDPVVIATRGMEQPFELRAEGGPDNVWIVEMGSRSENGSFDAFRNAVLGAEVTITRSVQTPIDALGYPLPKLFDRVTYHSPSQGLVEFGWDRPLVVAGEERPLRNALRFDNPWSRTAFDSMVYEIAAPSGKNGVKLDWSGPTREVWAAE